MQLRRLIIGLLSLTLALTTFLGATSSAEPGAGGPVATGSAADKPRGGRAEDEPWSGFSIRKTGKASGGWIGGRKYRGKPVYRIDPTARPRAGGFRALRTVDKLTGPKAKWGAGVRATSRAAWILSKYGDYRYDVQNAAVDAAVLQLLARRDWKLDRSAGKRRLKQTGQRRAVTKFAKIMLRASKTYAGPYTVTVTPVGAPVLGGTATIDVAVTAAQTGAPIRSLPVTVVADGVSVPAGETDESGHARVAVAAATLGTHPITVLVAKTPETRLLVRDPRSRKASRIAVAGRKVTLSVASSFTVRVTPAVRVADRTAPVASGSTVSSSFTLSGSDGAVARPAAVALYGPFEDGSTPTCTGTPAGTGTVQVAADGTYQLPTARLTLPARGTRYYFWSVSVPGTDTNDAASTCSGRITVVRLLRQAAR